MNNFMYEYTRKVEREFEDLKAIIVTLKLVFQSTIWTNEKLMIAAANEIWQHEKKLKDYTEVHNIILENYKEV